MTPAAARWSLPELNVKLTHLKNEHIKITIAENEDDNEEKESDTDHNDGGGVEDNEENQDENELENQDQLLKQLHKRYKQEAQDQESKLTLNDWCKSQKQNTCKRENDIAQQQLFTSGETVKKDAEQTKSQIHEQKQEKMNEHNMDEDIATDHNEQVQEKHQQQLESQPDSQEKMYQNIFVEMVGSIPKYYKDEMKPAHERNHELKEAVDYWIDKADDLKYKMQVAIQSCMEKNAFIEKICREKEAVQKKTKKLKKKLEQQEEQNKKLQAQLVEEKLKRRHLQNNYELLEREKMSCIETMKQNDFDIASLALWGLQHS
ncbi:inner centromere protein-like isoform X1 [Prunus avium]|uniref:Inner centromere protein-like isoform X1 n=1 Tax=Prunus avium TaxID=42229 RepID=A0A6P5T6F8_PRUAV|nr:inner centromere protein-like isoform X1 [Prunus avium]